MLLLIIPPRNFNLDFIFFRHSILFFAKRLQFFLISTDCETYSLIKITEI